MTLGWLFVVACAGAMRATAYPTSMLSGRAVTSGDPSNSTNTKTYVESYELDSGAAIRRLTTVLTILHDSQRSLLVSLWSS